MQLAWPGDRVMFDFDARELIGCRALFLKEASTSLRQMQFNPRSPPKSQVFHVSEARTHVIDDLPHQFQASNPNI